MMEEHPYCLMISPPGEFVIQKPNKGDNVKKALEAHEIYPPLGLAYIAAVLRENDIGVKIIDARSIGMSGEEVVDEVKRESPDFVGISVVTPLISSALNVSKRIKEELPTAKIIFGGPHIHFLHEEVIKADFVDFCVRGEGEFTTLELIRALSAREGRGRDRDLKLKAVKGITFKTENNGKIVVNQDRPFICDLDLLPFPARDLLPNHIYRRYVMGEEEKFTAVLASRGCPFRCHFCAVPSMWKKHRRRSVENVLDELEWVSEEYSIDNVRFSDDLFAANRKWVFEFCEAILDRGLDMRWSCDGRIGLMTAELLRQMKKAGCQYIFYGIEFGDQRILHFSGKGTTIKQIYDTIRHTREAGIISYGYFMIGYPTETKESIEKTISLSSDPNLGLDHAGFSLVTPFPGTPLYDYCRRNNLLRTDNWKDYNMIQPDNGVIKLPDVSSAELIDLYDRAHVEFRFRFVKDKLKEELRELLDL